VSTLSNDELGSHRSRIASDREFVPANAACNKFIERTFEDGGRR
jgi:hypothetical protein